MFTRTELILLCGDGVRIRLNGKLKGNPENGGVSLVAMTSKRATRTIPIAPHTSNVPILLTAASALMILPFQMYCQRLHHYLLNKFSSACFPHMTSLSSLPLVFTSTHKVLTARCTAPRAALLTSARIVALAVLVLVHIRPLTFAGPLI